MNHLSTISCCPEMLFIWNSSPTLPRYRIGFPVHPDSFSPHARLWLVTECSEAYLLHSSFICTVFLCAFSHPPWRPFRVSHHLLSKFQALQSGNWSPKWSLLILQPLLTPSLHCFPLSHPNSLQFSKFRRLFQVCAFAATVPSARCISFRCQSEHAVATAQVPSLNDVTFDPLLKLRASRSHHCLFPFVISEKSMG